MENKNESRTIRVSEKMYDHLDTSANRASETFDEILRRLLNFPEESESEKHEYAEDQLSGCLANKERMGKK